MVKVLFCGNLNKEWKLFDQKITNLTNSIHGPFDLVICCGIFFNNEESYQEYLHENINLPIPVYIFDHGNFLKNKVLPTNIYLLASVGAIIFQDLVIASYITNGDILYPEEYQKLLNSIKEIRYDILITSEWPQGFTNLLPISELHQLSEVGYVASNTAGSGQIIAELAATLRPRYHISSSLENPIFYQRLPYAQLSTPYSSAFPSIPWFTRFIGLASVSSSKEKHLKWIHALALDPISAPNTTHVSLVADLAQPHTPCPYAMLDTSAARSDEPPPKKIKNDLSNSTQNPGSFFFGEMAVPRSHKSAPKNTLLTPPSSDSKTLFFGGLPVPKSYGNKPTSLEGDIRRQFDGVVSFRQPNGKAFAFVEFDTPENAQRVVAMSQESPGVVIKGNPLTIGWAADSNNQNSSRISGLPVISPAILSPPTLDSKTLFVGGLPPCEEALDSQFESSLRQELISLFPGCVNVKRISHKSFAFLEFESHIQATTVMLAYSENNEAYQITDPGDSSKKRRLALGWSKGDNHQINQPQNGPQNNDCWFCLASPNVKTHLVVSVSDTMYLSLPRGGVTNYHVMIIPIDCLPSSTSLSSEAKSDLVKYQIALEDMFTSNSMTSIRYERCIHTKGSRNHLQIHVIPIPLSFLSSSLTSFHSIANKYHLQFHPIPEGIPLESMLSPPSESNPYGITGGPYEEYFYLELPLQDTPIKKRYVYVKDRSIFFPMHFGLELAAVIIQKPERANWKNCQQSEREEVELAENFRKSFERFDFT